MACPIPHLFFPSQYPFLVPALLSFLISSVSCPQSSHVWSPLPSQGVQLYLPLFHSQSHTGRVPPKAPSHQAQVLGIHSDTRRSPEPSCEPAPQAIPISDPSSPFHPLRLPEASQASPVHSHPLPLSSQMTDSPGSSEAFAGQMEVVEAWPTCLCRPACWEQVPSANLSCHPPHPETRRMWVGRFLFP